MRVALDFRDFCLGMWLVGVLEKCSWRIVCDVGEGVVIFVAKMGDVAPLVFRLLRIDPSVTLGPLITMLNDRSSLLLYIGIAVLFL